MFMWAEQEELNIVDFFSKMSANLFRDGNVIIHFASSLLCKTCLRQIPCGSDADYMQNTFSCSDTEMHFQMWDGGTVTCHSVLLLSG